MTLTLGVNGPLGFVYVDAKEKARSLPDGFIESKLMFVLSSDEYQKKFTFASMHFIRYI